MDTGGPQGPTGSVEGELVDALGEPLEGIRMTLCAISCRTATTESDGRFFFPIAEVANHVLENATSPGPDSTAGAHAYSRVFDIITLVEPVALVLERPLVLREVIGSTLLPQAPETLILDGGLEVTVDASALSHLPAPAEAPWLGGFQVDQAEWPTGGLGAWTILAAWGMAVWDMEIPDGFSVRAPLPEALETTADVALLVADYTYGFQHGVFFEEGATLEEGGTVISTAAGLDRSTLWLAVTKTSE